MDTLGCFAVDSIYLMVSCEGTLEMQGLLANVHPNPFNNQLKLHLKPGLIGQTNILLFDITGKEMYWNVVNDTQEIELNLGWLKPGTYILEVRNAGFVSRIKVIKI